MTCLTDPDAVTGPRRPARSGPMRRPGTADTLIASEFAGGSLGPVGNDRRRHHRCVGHGERVDEARAHRLQIEGGAAMHAQLVLQDRRGGREHHVRCRSGHDDQIDVAGLAPRRFQRIPCRGQRQVTGVHAVVGEVARADARALDDPLIAGLDTARREHRHHVVVGQPPRRQVAARARDARKGRARRSAWRSRHGRRLGHAACSGAATLPGNAAIVGPIRSCTRASN